METLKDIKNELDKIPDEILEKCQFGIGENNEDSVSLIFMGENYPEIFEKYEGLSTLNNLIENIKKAQDAIDNGNELILEDLQENGVTDTFFKDRKEH